MNENQTISTMTLPTQALPHTLHVSVDTPTVLYPLSAPLGYYPPAEMVVKPSRLAVWFRRCKAFLLANTSEVTLASDVSSE